MYANSKAVHEKRSRKNGKNKLKKSFLCNIQFLIYFQGTHSLTQLQHHLRLRTQRPAANRVWRRSRQYSQHKKMVDRKNHGAQRLY